MYSAALQYSNTLSIKTRTRSSSVIHDERAYIFDFICSLRFQEKEMSDKAPTNKICRRASSEQRPRTRSCHEWRTSLDFWCHLYLWFQKKETPIGTLEKSCSTLQHTATPCNTLQHLATHCITLQHTAAHCSTLLHTAAHYNTLQHTAAHYITLHHIASHGSTLPQFATHCNILQHTATNCNTLQNSVVTTENEWMISIVVRAETLR